MTLCKLSKPDDVCSDSDEEYKPESDPVSNVDDKRRWLNRESHLFDPENQITKYNTKVLPDKIPVVDIMERAIETASYHWLAKYDSVPSNSPFNKFLNKFKNGSFAPKIAEFEGVRYRFLRVGTTNKLNSVRQYNQFVIGIKFTIFRLGMNDSPNVNIGVSARARERRLPPPINKKFTISSLFWANGLLKSQKAW